MIDIGVNLGHRRFAGDLAEVLARARRAGVRAMIATGTSVSASERALSVARACPDVWCTAGVHPHEARSLDARGLDRLRTLAKDDRVVVIGECGLDYDRNFSEPGQQRWAFEAQLELAAELGMPVFLHERDAHDDFVAILARHRDRLPRAVVHCFTGQARALDVYLEMDLHIGITGWICDRKRGAHLDPLVGRIPSDRLMIETDAPFLTPPEAKQKRNEPAFLSFVRDQVARATGKPPDQIAHETEATARAFFELAR
jgi:TatD DNase family protein